jgi:hypothetical protein
MPRFARYQGYDVPKVIQSERGYHFRNRPMPVGSCR